MTAQLRRARLIPLDDQGKPLAGSEEIVFDFNPETLNIKVSNTLENVPAQRGRQPKQFVGSSSSTLTFDAVFDSTRPKNLAGESPGGETKDDLDVRKRTAVIADLIQVSDTKATHPAPKRVRFSWGSILFDGLIDSYTEVLEYFSPEGVPLRSKVSLSLKEQSFEYKIDEEQRAALASFGGAGGGFNLGLSVSAGLELGVGVDLGFSAGAAIDVSAGAAMEVFGGAAVQAAVGGDMDLSATSRGDARAPAGAITGSTPTPWAPAGPPAGSRGAALATIVHEQRASGAPPDPTPPGGSFTATDISTQASVVPVPVRGSPPQVSATLGPPRPPALFARARSRPASQRSLAGDRPRWEDLPSGSKTVSIPGERCSCCGELRAARGSAGTIASGPGGPGHAGCGCAGRRTSW